MARTGGDLTKKKILSIAEKLFSEKGFDGTSIQTIADTSKVNKALIYYHFKNKQDIIDSLFEQTLDELFCLQSKNTNQKEKSLINPINPEARLNEIIAILEKKKKILSVMLMEALKDEGHGHISLFKCAEMIISKNVSERMHSIQENYKQDAKREELLMHEFFTGFIPIVFFSLFKDKWADFFKCNRKETMSMFSKVFNQSHISQY